MNMPIHAQFLRGDHIQVLRTNVHGVGSKEAMVGDTLKVARRKAGGWLRVRSDRTGQLLTIRSGRHLCRLADASKPASQIDLLIRENQVLHAQQKEKESEKMTKYWKDHYDALTEKNDNLQKDCADLMRRVHELAEQLREEIAERNSLARRLDEASEACEHARSKVAQQKQVIDDTLGEAAWLRERVAELEAEKQNTVGVDHYDQILDWEESLAKQEKEDGLWEEVEPTPPWACPCNAQQEYSDS